MAITAAGAYNAINVALPAGYTNPTITPLVTPADNGSYETDITASGVANADPVVGAGALITAVEAHFEGTYAIATLKLDATTTIAANLTIQSSVRLNDGDDTSQFQTGTEVYRIRVKYEYA